MFRNLNPAGIRGIRNLEIPQKTICDLARANRFEGVDINIEELTKLHDEKPIDVIKNLPFWGTLKLGGWSLPTRWREDDSLFQQELERLSEYALVANQLSCKIAYEWISPASNKLPFRQNFRWHTERLRQISEVLKSRRCILSLEYVGVKTFREGQKYTFIHDMEGMLRLIDIIGLPNVRVTLDSFHWYAAEETLTDIKTLDSDQIGYVHVNDVPKGVSRGDLVDNERRLPGETGVIDLIGFLRSILEVGYDGPVTPETMNTHLRDMSTEKAVKAAGDAFYDLWSKIEG